MKQMMKNAGPLFLFALWSALASAQMAIACACCADPGYRQHSSLPVSNYDISVLSELELDGLGILYTTACADDCITGINWFAGTADTEIRVFGDSISIVLNSGSSSQTVLTAGIPEEMTYLAKDPKPGDGSTTVWVTTEFLFPLKILGSGPGWTGGTDALSAQLIFYGGGNACPDFEMIDHWLLDVGGPEQSARFRLFGKLLHNP